MWGKHRREPHRWTRKDILLALAHHAYSGQLCPDCGHSTILSFNDFNAGEYLHKDDKYCLACEVRDHHREDKREPGQKSYVVCLIGTEDSNADLVDDEMEGTPARREPHRRITRSAPTPR
jgi:hypothetical protein